MFGANFDEDFIMGLVSRIESNNFGLWTRNHMTCYGRALYPYASFFNHSCVPNCEVQINGPFLSIYAIQDIPKGKI
jgi:SET domain-containing protein